MGYMPHTNVSSTNLIGRTSLRTCVYINRRWCKCNCSHVLHTTLYAFSGASIGEFLKVQPSESYLSSELAWPRATGVAATISESGRPHRASSKISMKAVHTESNVQCIVQMLQATADTALWVLHNAASAQVLRWALSERYLCWCQGCQVRDRSKQHPWPPDHHRDDVKLTR